MVDFESNTRLVYRVFEDSFSGYRDIKDDLVQEGLIGLWNACQTFDATRRVAFSTYATVCIKNAMLEYLRKELRYRSRYVSLDNIIDQCDENEESFLEKMPDEEEMEKRKLSEKAEYILKLAEDKNCREILEMKMQGMTQVQIARHLKVTEATISYRLKEVKEYLRLEMKKNSDFSEKTGENEEKAKNSKDF